MDKYYQCTKCGKTFIYEMPHKCQGNFQKHHLQWKFLANKAFNDTLNQLQNHITDIINKLTNVLNTYNKESNYTLVLLDSNEMIISKYEVSFVNNGWYFNVYEAYKRVSFEKILYDMDYMTVEDIDKAISIDSYYIIEEDGMTKGLTKLF